VSATPRWGVSVYKERFRFCAAHFLVFPDGSREELHGHNYRVSVEVEGPLGEGDVVVDFMHLKPLVQRLCDALDHRTLVAARSPHLRVERDDDLVWVHHRDGRFAFPLRDVELLPVTNTSTELLAAYLCARLRESMARRLPERPLHRIRVTVEESSGQSGWYEERLGPVAEASPGAGR